MNNLFHEYLNQYIHMMKSIIPIVFGTSLARTLEWLIVALIGIDDIDGMIGFSLCMAFIFHGIGWYLSIRPPNEKEEVSYLKYRFLCIGECSGNLWLQFCLHVIFMRMEANDYGTAFGVWVGLLCISIVVILLSKIAASFIKDLNPRNVILLRHFDSMAFAYSISLVITYIIAAAIRGKDYEYYGARFQYTDDDETDDTEVHSSSLYFFLYCICITLIIGFMQSYTSEMDIDDVLAVLFSYDKDSDDKQIEISHELGFQSSMSLLDEIKVGLYHYYNLCSAFFVGTSWFVLSLMTFVGLFTFSGGKSIGIFLYVNCMTLLILCFITYFDLILKSKLEIREKCSSDTMITRTERVTLQMCILTSTAFRLAIGWLWDIFFASIVEEFTFNRNTVNHEGKRWLKFLILLVFTVVLYWVGFEYWKDLESNNHNYYNNEKSKNDDEKIPSSLPLSRIIDDGKMNTKGMEVSQQQSSGHKEVELDSNATRNQKSKTKKIPRKKQASKGSQLHVPLL